MFNIHDDYAQLMTGAHRKPATIVGAPALVRHLALWIPPRYAAVSDTVEQRREARQSWRRNIDKYLAQVYRRIREQRIKVKATNQFHKTGSGKIELFASDMDAGTGEIDSELHDTRSRDYQVITYEFDWHAMHATMRFELHTEYFSVSVFVDISRHSKLEDPEQLRAEKPVLAKIWGKLDHLQEILKDGSAVDGASAVHEHLYYELWKIFFANVAGTSKNRDGLGSLFVDFRGVVLGPPPARLGGLFRKPYSKKGDDAAPIMDAEGFPPREDELKADLANLWPWIVTKDAVSEIDFKDVELTVSRMAGGRAIYVTALGPQPPDAEHATEGHFPLLYFMYAYTQNSYQIGRLIDRIHHLGTVRIAAIMEIERLRNAGRGLRTIEKKVDDAFDKVHGSAKAQDRETEDAAEGLVNAFKGIQEQINATKRPFEGGLGYRIERSRYYVLQFRQGVRSLRIERIEGYQPYDQFVERRLGSAFDYINMLGRRYDDMIKDTTLLYQYFLAQNAARISEDIDERNTRIEHLQAVGEVVLFALLAPYYGAMIIEHAFHLKGVSEQLAWQSVVLVFQWVAYARAADYRHESRKRVRGEANNKVGWFASVLRWLRGEGQLLKLTFIGWMLALIALTIWFLWFWSMYAWTSWGWTVLQRLVGFFST